MAERYKVYMITSFQMDQYTNEGIPPNTPYLDSDGSITYTSNKQQEA
jgi:hypothetical protein